MVYLADFLIKGSYLSVICCVNALISSVFLGRTVKLISGCAFQGIPFDFQITAAGFLYRGNGGTRCFLSCKIRWSSGKSFHSAHIILYIAVNLVIILHIRFYGYRNAVCARVNGLKCYEFTVIFCTLYMVSADAGYLFPFQGNVVEIRLFGSGKRNALRHDINTLFEIGFFG